MNLIIIRITFAIIFVKPKRLTELPKFHDQKSSKNELIDTNLDSFHMRLTIPLLNKKIRTKFEQNSNHVVNVQ